MKQGLSSLVDLAKEIERQNDEKQDYMADTRSMSLSANGSIHLNMEGTNGDTMMLPVNATAARQMGDKVGIPAKYFDKMKENAPELLATNVNHWFATSPKKHLIRTLSGNVRAFLSDRYQRIDNVDVAQTILPVLLDEGQGLTIQSCDITESKMYIKAVMKSLQRDVKVGDTVEAGVWITNSEIGRGLFEVAPFIHRLICMNGQKVNDAKFGRRHVGGRTVVNENTYRVLTDETLRADDHAFLLKARDVVKAAFDEKLFEANVDKLRDTTERKLEGNPVKAIEVLGKSTGLLVGEQTGILRHLIEGADLSQYGVIQAVTRFSQDVESYDRASELEELGGKLVDLTEREWKPIAIAA